MRSPFQAYDSNGHILPHIRQAFLKSFELTAQDYKEGKVLLHDGSEWQIRFPSASDATEVLSELVQYHDCYVIGSFQLLRQEAQRIVYIRKDQVCKEKQAC